MTRVNDKTTAERLFFENKDLAHWLIKMYYFQYLHNDDMTQEALIGLWKACRTWNPGIGTKFSSYASRVILNEIRMAYRRERPPEFIMISLDDDIPDAEGLTMADMIEDPNGNIEDSGVFLKDFMSRLTAKEKAVVEMLAQGFTQKEIGARLGFSRAYCSKIKTSIRNKYKRSVNMYGKENRSL